MPVTPRRPGRRIADLRRAGRSPPPAPAAAAQVRRPVLGPAPRARRRPFGRQGWRRQRRPVGRRHEPVAAGRSRCSTSRPSGRRCPSWRPSGGAPPAAQPRAVNFVVRGILGWAWPRTCASTRKPRAWASCCALVRSRSRSSSWSRGAGRAQRCGRAAPGESGAVGVIRFIAFLIGILLVLGTVWSVFTALVVPRVPPPVHRGLARMLGGGAAHSLAPKLPTYEVHDRVLSFVGPAAMVLLFIIWLTLLVLGFGLIIWWEAGVDFATALGRGRVVGLHARDRHRTPGPRPARSWPPASASWSLRSRSPTCPPSTALSPPRDAGHLC